ncbi:UNVERIFIED_CONTAM: hypothetical protein Sradi_5199600 [Sesamum radiatum]|uniref:Uncharacterized protein n=1 Tax=Sesamum radiatum TaxID=300843 RepID=A0AAW2M6Y7_SESRA
MYEAEYEASLKSIRESTDLHDIKNQHAKDTDGREDRALDDSDDYDDGIDLQDDQMEEDDDVGHDDEHHSSASKPHIFYTEEASHVHLARKKKQNFDDKDDKASAGFYSTESLADSQHNKINENSAHASSIEDQPVRRLKATHFKKEIQTSKNFWYFASSLEQPLKRPFTFSDR